jgi:hypothetical protein
MDEKENATGGQPVAAGMGLSTSNGAHPQYITDPSILAKVENLVAGSLRTREQLEANQRLSAAKVGDPPGQPAFNLINLSELLKQPNKIWLIDRVIGAGDIGMIFGAPGSGKTFVVIDLIFAACLGWRWALRFDVLRPLTVVYAAGEGVSGLKDRFLAAATHYGVGDGLPNFSFSDIVPQLFDSSGPTISQFISQWQERQAAGGPGLDLLIVDTLHSATVGADENSAQDMGKVLAAAKLAARELGCAVLLVHHSNKAGTGERGSSALRGAMDCMIEIKRVSENGTKAILCCAKLKDGESWKEQTFDLVDVDDCTSVRVWWDHPTDDVGRGNGKQSVYVDSIVKLLKNNPGKKYTANALAEGIGLGGSKQIFKLLPLAMNLDDVGKCIKTGLKHPDRDANPHNPRMYWYEPEPSDEPKPAVSDPESSVSH